MTAPRIPPSRTKTFDPAPKMLSGTSSGKAAKNAAKSSISAGMKTTSAAPPTRNQQISPMIKSGISLPRKGGKAFNQSGIIFIGVASAVISAPPIFAAIHWPIAKSNRRPCKSPHPRLAKYRPAHRANRHLQPATRHGGGHDCADPRPVPRC